MTMYAIMKYENGLKFTGIIGKTVEDCKEYMKKAQPEMERIEKKYRRL